MIQKSRANIQNFPHPRCHILKNNTEDDISMTFNAQCRFRKSQERSADLLLTSLQHWGKPAGIFNGKTTDLLCKKTWNDDRKPCVSEVWKTMCAIIFRPLFGGFFQNKTTSETPQEGRRNRTRRGQVRNIAKTTAQHFWDKTGDSDRMFRSLMRKVRHFV